MPDNTPEYVALELMKMIAAVEKKELIPPSAQGKTMADRAWILQTYAQCLECVKHPNAASGQP